LEAEDRLLQQTADSTKTHAEMSSKKGTEGEDIMRGTMVINEGNIESVSQIIFDLK
jgi:hypothetical protein